jgi:hypothetical protein
VTQPGSAVINGMFADANWTSKRRIGKQRIDDEIAHIVATETVMPTVEQSDGVTEIGALVQDFKQEAAIGEPNGRSSRKRWVEFAVSLGIDVNDLDGLDRTQIRALIEERR